MLVRDVVNQLRLILPQYTDLFSDVIEVESVTADAGLVTIVTTSPHGLQDGAKVTLNQIQTRTPITDLLSQEGFIFTFGSAEHDLTLNSPDHINVSFGGFSASEWNDTFKLINVQNRQKFSIQSSNSSPVLTGNEYLLEDRIDGIRGDYEIIVVDPTTFTVSGDFPDGTYTAANIASNIRIAGSRSLERFANDHYTNQSADNRLWGVIEPHQSAISKDRSTFSDATATFPAGTDMRLRLIDGFTFSVVVRIVNEIAAVQAIDICRGLRPAIYKSLFGTKFVTGFSNSEEFLTIPIGDREAILTKNNNAYYIHLFDFEVQMDVTIEDAVSPRNTRAFRDIFYTQEVGEQEMTSRIDLDDKPITS
jgi:hypothetical protein